MQILNEIYYTIYYYKQKKYGAIFQDFKKNISKNEIKWCKYLINKKKVLPLQSQIIGGIIYCTENQFIN